MKENLDIATDFAEKAAMLKNKNIMQLVLFGSVARGEDKPSSDVDIAIIHKGDKFQLMKCINRIMHEKIQVTYIKNTELPKEHEIVFALTGEGLLLYGEPINLKVEKKEAKPKILLTYSLSGLSAPDRMRINRALNGGISRNTYKGKKYESQVVGLANEPGVEKFSRSVLIIDPKKYPKIKSLLTQFKASFKEKDIIMY